MDVPRVQDLPRWSDVHPPPQDLVLAGFDLAPQCAQLLDDLGWGLRSHPDAGVPPVVEDTVVIVRQIEVTGGDAGGDAGQDGVLRHGVPHGVSPAVHDHPALSADQGEIPSLRVVLLPYSLMDFSMRHEGHVFMPLIVPH
jgi:hypothetical protein